MNFKVGDWVERMSTDYTNGRQGQIVETDGGDSLPGKTRFRVLWTHQNGKSIGKEKKRTWVSFKIIKKCNAPSV